ncbi:hypothetical protein [Anabaena sp. CCY 9402-a]
MKNKQQIKTNKSKEDQASQLPKLQQLNFSQLDDVTGGLVLLFANPFA